MRHRLALATIAVAGALGFGHISAAPAAPTAAAQSCRSGSVSAHLSWGDRCLQAGQFCKVGNREYLKYGFVCSSSRHLRRR